MNGFNRMMIFSCLSFCSFISAMDIDQQLIRAAGNGDVQQVQNLLERGADIEAKDDFDNTPLHCAVFNGHEFVARLLLKNKANINAKDGFGWTPLHWAVSAGHEAVVRLLLENNADIKAKDIYGDTPLQLDASERQAIVKLLENWLAFQELLRNSREKNFVFCMAQHPRLGANSSANVLPNELFYYIFKLSKPTIEEITS